MQEVIFKSFIRMIFPKKQIENHFQTMINKKINQFIKPTLIFYLTISLANSIFLSYFLDQINSIPFLLFNIITSYMTSILYLFFIFAILLTKKVKIYRWINYFVFYLKIFVLISFRYAILRIVNNSNIIIFFIVFLEFFLRIFWVLMYFQSFTESMTLNLITLTTVWILLSSLYPCDFKNEEMKYSLAYSLLIVTVIVIVWIIERFQRLAFYYKWKAEEKTTKILGNIRSGYMSVKGGKVNYINKYLLSIIKDNYQTLNDSSKGKFY
jgi:hypothetical protein